MKKIFCLIVIGFCAGCSFLFSQPVVTYASFPNGVERLKYSIGSSATPLDLPGGRQKTWDLSELKPIPASEIAYTNDCKSQERDVFPGSNMFFSAFSSPDDYTFLNINESMYEYLGFISNANSNLYTAKYSDSWIIYSFPLRLNNTFEDTYACNSRMIYASDTIDYFFRGHYSYLVDGFGTLLTPKKTILNCLRINATIAGSDSAVYRNKRDSSYVNNFVSKKVSWLSSEPGNYCEVATTFNFTDFFFAEVSDKPATSTGNGSSKKLVIYPDPATTTVEVDLRPVEKGAMDIMLMNSSGSPIKTFHLTNSSPETGKYKISVSDLSAGIYYIRLKTNDGFWDATFVKQ